MEKNKATHIAEEHGVDSVILLSADGSDVSIGDLPRVMIIGMLEHIKFSLLSEWQMEQDMAELAMLQDAEATANGH